jgi:hypothetical protein
VARSPESDPNVSTLLRIALFMSVAVAVGFAALYSAATPAACGVAIEVPLNESYASPPAFRQRIIKSSTYAPSSTKISSLSRPSRRNTPG